MERRKYFTIHEFKETLSSTRVYRERKKEVREYTYIVSGAKYIGDWNGGFRHGHGVMKWPDGAIYEGDWKDNHAHGKGKFTHAVGDIYEGEWVRDKASGKGIYKSA